MKKVIWSVLLTLLLLISPVMAIAKGIDHYKLSMNWKLIQYSIWSRVLLAALAGLTFLMFYPKGIFKTLEKEYSWIFKGIKAVVVACIVGFIVNDSGVVQAATTAVYIIFPLIYLVMEKKSQQELL